MLRRRVFSIAFAIIGCGLITSPDRYRSLPSYSTLFRAAGPVAWGWLFVVVAVVIAIRRVPQVAAAMVGSALMFAWSAGLVHAALVDHTASPTGWVWPALLAVLIMLSPITVPQR